VNGWHSHCCCCFLRSSDLRGRGGEDREGRGTLQAMI
jgi:hypothetical protein